ncbi:MAG: Beta-lactamase domain protein [Chthoniobacteraceae bacterium]|nr:Beta-lactamase domain protein [Chthoniobacteraceae bacterium]
MNCDFAWMIPIPSIRMSDLTITFLGTGTSQGVPMIGCDCTVCSSTDLRNKRTRSSIYVQSAECAFVVDTGPDFRAQCLRERVRALDAVVYTHSHTDHIMGFDDLRAFCPPDGGTLPIYAGEETMRDLERVFNFAFNGLNRFPGYVRPDPRIVDAPFQLGEIELTPLPVPHGRAKVFGYLFTRAGERLAAYLSDCKMVPEPVIEKIAGVRHLIVDALRHKLHPTHMNVTEALEVIAKVGPKQAWFTHLCHDLDHEETEAALPEGIRIAFDGMKIVV